MSKSEYSIETEDLSYSFPGSTKVGLFNINIKLPQSSRLLLVGPNGAGKSTLLKILAGQKLIKQGKILLNGCNPFELNRNSQLGKTTGVVTYLGTEWANNQITQRDIPVTILISSIGGDIYPERRDLLINLLDIDINWRMNQCSDGERRRVQLAMGLLKPWDILLLDEVTVDLDVLVRSRLLVFLKEETEKRNATVVYATHIFDGLGEWPTDILHINGGCEVQKFKIDQIKYVTNGKEDEKSAPLNQQGYSVPVYEELPNGKRVKIEKTNSLYPLALSWLNTDLKLRGERSEENTRPKLDELTNRMTDSYYDGKDRITDYFKVTRSVN